MRNWAPRFVVGALALIAAVAIISSAARDESPVNGGDVRSSLYGVELLSNNDNLEKQDVAEANKQSQAAHLEMAKSQLIRAEAALDVARATVTNTAARVDSATQRIAALRKTLAQNVAAQERISKREAKIRKLEKADNAATTSLGEEAGSHAANIPLLVARVPDEKKEIKRLQLKAVKARESARTLEEKHAELQQSTVGTLESSITQEEDAQSQFALANADIARAKAKELAALKDAKQSKVLASGVHDLATRAKAAKLKYQLASQEQAAKQDALQATKLRLAALQSKLSSLTEQTGVRPAAALQAVDSDKLFPARKAFSPLSKSSLAAAEATAVIKAVSGVKGKQQEAQHSKHSRLGGKQEDDAANSVVSSGEKLKSLEAQADLAALKAKQLEKKAA